MELEQEIKSPFKNSRHRAVINVFFTYSWLNEKFVKALKPYHLTLQQYNILRILRGQHPKPATIKLLKSRMLDKMSDVSRIVEKLRIKGMVERNSCASDRRNVDVIITEKGLHLLENMENIVDNLNNTLSHLSDTEIDELNILLDKIRS